MLVWPTARRVAAPLVDYSERAFRLLCARFGAQLVYTPMLNARLVVEERRYAERHFDPHPSEADRLIVQLAGHDRDVLLAAARQCVPNVAGVDLNLGCPQEIARRGRYGAFLLEEEPALAASLVAELSRALHVPVSVKVRLMPTMTRTLEVCRRLQDAGAASITVHGRTRRQTRQLDGCGAAVSPRLREPPSSASSLLASSQLADASTHGNTRVGPPARAHSPPLVAAQDWDAIGL
eukprot:3378994-Prymnesium_polylepis.1